MSKAISSIEGIGPAFADKLATAGINTVEGLLEKGSQKNGRKTIAEQSGVPEATVLNWVNMADLFRINGIAGQFAELLKASGVDTVKELAQRNPESMHKMLTETNAQKNLTKVVPNVTQITEFINQAKNLEQRVFH